MKRLSVIIPGYNTPKAWWQRCVSSVQAAIGPDDEIIVVDDGSKVPVEANWFGPDERIRLLRRDNGGLARARNSAFDVAVGQFVTFVDSDDKVYPETFEHCLLSLNDSNADIVIYGVRTIWPDEGLQKTDVEKDKYYGELSAEGVLYLVNHRLFNYACNKVYRADFLHKNRLLFDPDGMPCEDIIFNLNCVMAGAKWCMVEYVGYVYYRCGMTLLSSYKPSNKTGLLHASDAWLKYKCNVSDGFIVFGKFGECDAASMLHDEWANLWKHHSPFDWRQKREWLVAHKEHMKCTKSLSRMMLEMSVLTFLRKYCYVRPIRRWNIKRQYPYAVEWNGER